ncbi:hypothetical protein M9H77_04889 [Catharanthus roseus]|uniref:Uncharacterized protein n=1 Tax=Catharanthus roseus TaxID=4058 RepID=A0ACC0CFD6_CATRO|nr:hypothetical protein M9H77_04889 [Catharanthus roseus]
MHHLARKATFISFTSSSICRKIMNMANMFGTTERKNSQHLRFEEFVPSSGLTEDSDSYCLIIDLPGFKRDQVKLQVDGYGRIVATGERQVNEYKHIRFDQSYKVPGNSNIEDTTAKFEDEILYVIIPKKAKVEKEPPQQEITNIPDAVANEEKETKQNAADTVPEPLVQEAKDKDNDQKSDAAGNDGHKQDQSHGHRHSDEETSSKEEEEEEHDDDDDDDEEEEETEQEFHDAKMEQRNEITLMAELVKQLKKNKGFLITAVLAFSLGILISQKLQPNEKYEISSTS